MTTIDATRNAGLTNSRAMGTGRVPTDSARPPPYLRTGNVEHRGGSNGVVSAERPDGDGPNHVRPEADAVRYIQKLLKKNGINAHLQSNFAAHSNGASNGHKTLTITAASSLDRDLAYATLANLSKSMRLSRGGQADVSTISADPLRRGQASNFALAVDPTVGRKRMLLVTLVNGEQRGAVPHNAPNGPLRSILRAPHNGARHLQPVPLSFGPETKSS